MDTKIPVTVSNIPYVLVITFEVLSVKRHLLSSRGVYFFPDHHVDQAVWCFNHLHDSPSPVISEQNRCDRLHGCCPVMERVLVLNPILPVLLRYSNEQIPPEIEKIIHLLYTEKGIFCVLKEFKCGNGVVSPLGVEVLKRGVIRGHFIPGFSHGFSKNLCGFPCLMMSFYTIYIESYGIPACGDCTAGCHECR